MELINIWQKPEAYPEVIQFWKNLNVLPKGVDPEERANQLVFMARAANGTIAGVTTSQRIQVKQLNNHYFFSFRVLISPPHRSPGLVSKLTVLTRDHMQNLFLEGKTDCIGMITIVENPKLMQMRNEAVWRASKFVYIGNTKSGHHTRVYYFPGVKI